MVIKFHNVMPEPLSSITHGDRSIWGNTFTIDSNKKVMLNASSGKGKTTFTHLLSGIRKDYEGDVYFDDKLISDFTVEDWTQIRKKELSIVFQDLQLFPDLTVEENLVLKNDLNRLYTLDKIKELLDFLGIVDKWNKKCRILSMGQQQRVAIVRAMLQPYQWLLMDEPFSHLDQENTNKCLELITDRTDELSAGFILTTLGDPHGVNYDQTLQL
jgi:ABC-type lipoprotein export system ATPase subunit